MNVHPPDGTPPGARGPQEEQEQQQPQYQVPPKKQFPGQLQDQDEEGEEPTKTKSPKKKHKGKAAQTQKKFDGPMALIGQNVAVGTVAERAAGTGGASGNNPIDRIVEVFQNNQLFGAGGVTNVSITERADSSVIGVTLDNGVEVNISLFSGQELNITIAGLAAAAQAAADNAENQMLMRDKLMEQGFIVHQIQTFRGEGTTGGAPATPPPGETLPQQEGGAGERHGEGQDRGEPEGEGEGFSS